MEWPISWEDVKKEIEALKPQIIDLDACGATDVLMELMTSGGGQKTIGSKSTCDVVYEYDYENFWRSIMPNKPTIGVMNAGVGSMKYITIETIGTTRERVHSLSAVMTSVDANYRLSVDLGAPHPETDEGFYGINVSLVVESIGV